MQKLTREEIEEQNHRFSRQETIVVCDNIRSAQNVGSIFRSADALGVFKLVLCGISARPPLKEIHKTALGAELTVPWVYYESTAEALEALHAEGYTTLAVEQTDTAVALNEFRPDPGKKYALILGNEVDGVGQTALEQADGAVQIPQAGIKHSLNVSVAAGIALWHFFARN